jgi:hypothetical protein
MRKMAFFKDPIGGPRKFEKGRTFRFTGGEVTEPRPSQYKYCTRTAMKNCHILSQRRYGILRKERGLMIYGRRIGNKAQSGLTGTVRKIVFFRNPLIIAGGKLNSERRGHLSGILHMESEKTSYFSRALIEACSRTKKVSILFLERTIFFPLRGRL